MRLKYTKLIAVVSILWSPFCVKAQELFVFTEPASNMAKGNLGIRLMNSIMKQTDGNGYNTHFMPEVMYGFSNKLMAHSSVFLSNRNNTLVTEGFSLYAKYKFLNNDEVKRHFRMTTFARYSFNNSDIHQEEINLIGHNSGYELGVIATQLLHKVAISGGLSFIEAINNGNKYQFPTAQSANALYYTLSFGKLMLPKKYTSYNQTNVNLMCEFLGQSLLPNGKIYVDVAPSIQFIFLSKMRLDLAYRQQLYTNMQRTTQSGFVVRLEYNFFNVH
jgi:hypothetical protein